MLELRHAKRVDRDYAELAFTILAVATRQDPQTDEEHEEVKQMCDAAIVLFALSDIEESFENLWRALQNV